MTNPLSPMARVAARENDASMSMSGALQTMKSVGPALHPEVSRHISRRFRNRGFSLMELLVALAAIGILMSIGMPIYKDYLIRANQAAAKAVLLEVASRQEQYLIKAGAYSGAYTATGCVFGELAYTAPVEVCDKFDLALVAGTLPNTYSVDAMQGLPTFRVSASGKAGTLQAGFPAAGAATEFSINQFGLKLPVSAW